MFHLRFDQSEVPFWAKRYVEQSKPADMRGETDIDQILAPAAKARGYLTRDEFLEICHWKSRRPKPYYARNTDDFIQAATATALSTPSEQLRIEVLTLLSGVKWPVASAILHWTHVDPYPILDVRALWSLGWSEMADRPSLVYDFGDWREYTLYCRQLRQECDVTMRELDRALWQYAKEHMPRTPGHDPGEAPQETGSWSD